jgi:WD40 repeat protein
VAHSNGAVTEWDYRKPDGPLSILQVHNDDCRSVEINPSCEYFITSSFDSTSVVYNMNTKEVH